MTTPNKDATQSSIPNLLDRLCGRLIVVPLDSIAPNEKDSWCGDIVMLDRIYLAMVRPALESRPNDKSNSYSSALAHVRRIESNHDATLKKNGVDALLKTTAETIERLEARLLAFGQEVPDA